MRHLSKYALGLSLLLLFGWLFWSANGDQVPVWGSKAKPTATPEPVQHGNFGRYLYGITNIGMDKKMAQFDPTVPADDAVVLDVLRQVGKDGYGIVISPDLQPEVETVNENNYVTFTVGKEKIYFELFRNSAGMVGTVRFWRKELP